MFGDAQSGLPFSIQLFPDPEFTLSWGISSDNKTILVCVIMLRSFAILITIILIFGVLGSIGTRNLGLGGHRI